MKPKSKPARKLSLSGETLRNLRGEELEAAAGAWTRTCTWAVSCLQICGTLGCDSNGNATCFTVCPCTIA